MAWTFEEGRPIYLQLIEQMKLRIASGAYRPGDQVPPVRELALEAGVNPNTMQRAFAQLEQEGLLYAVRTSGRFITEEASVLENLRASLGNRFIEEMFHNLERLGMEREEIVQAVRRWADQSDEPRQNEEVR